jgi:MFS family permease
MSLPEPTKITPSLPNTSHLTLENPLGRTGWASLLDLTGYHWFVFTVAALGWLADCMDQQLFVLARENALAELMHQPLGHPEVTTAVGNATAIFLIGWATGGIFFGIMGDVFGRVRTMMLTILMYSLCTGLSSFSVGQWDFMFYRFLTGLGVGGEFAVGVALLAETMPERARPFMLGLLQAFSAIGNVTAALLYMWLGRLEQGGSFTGLSLWGWPVTPWRVLFLIGTVPALIAVLVRGRLKEPERWKAAVASQSIKQRLGSFPLLFREPLWRKHALFGLLLAFAGVVGLWGIGFFAPQLAGVVLRPALAKEGFEGAALSGELKIWGAWTSVMINLGAALGMLSFSWLTSYTGRRPAFFITFLMAGLSTIFVFRFLNTRSDIFWMMPVMGFFQLALFGGYAIYLPELFPTRLRSTGTSFCYNIGRFVAASGPPVLGLLITGVFTPKNGYPEGMRQAGMVMCSVFLLGILALPFLPETKGKPLPEDAVS